MAIGWLAALKLVPWSTVLEAAPHIVKGARSLIAKTKKAPSATTTTPPPPEESLSDSDKLTNLNRRFHEMQANIVELNNEQKSSAELIQLLAEQNAQIVKAIDIFRRRIKLLIVICGILSVVTVLLTLRITAT